MAGAGLVGFLLFSGQTPVSTASPTPTVEPTPSFNQELRNNRLTVRLLGLDTNEARRNRGSGINSDTIMVASVNAGQSEITLISVPRDTVDVPLPDGTLCSRRSTPSSPRTGPRRWSRRWGACSTSRSTAT